VVSGHSTSVIVNSLGAEGLVLLHWSCHSKQGFGLGVVDMVWGGRSLFEEIQRFFQFCSTVRFGL